MTKINIKKFIFLIIIFLYPAALWATRGPEDYCIIMALMAMLYSFPVGLLLLGFIIYSIIKLKSKDIPDKKQGKIIFIVSLTVIILSTIIPILWICWAENNFKMFELMSGVFIPILILAVTSLITAKRLKRRIPDTKS